MDARLQIEPCPVAATLRLQRELGVSRPVAQVLVRRGLSDPTAARAFMDPREEHDPAGFDSIDVAVAVIMRRIESGDTITVHGDYDADGVCSTAVLVRALRGLGARVDWYLPDRATDGYGLGEATVRRLALRGTQLLITVDCAITAVEPVATARRLGIEVVVTDHHAPRADGVLPDAAIVHPALCGYPFPELCATAVAYKLALALYRTAGRDPAAVHEDLDLVALATVADVVPLRGENRTLVTRGLRTLAVTAKPGLRALMAVAGVEAARVTARSVGFALAPRLNASGRLGRADAALELLLTADPARAAEVAQELDRANHERRHVETRILFEALARVRELGEQPAYVLAGEGWHPGVVGIVAARVVERQHRPVLCLALEDGRARGSGRSIPSFDLLGGLHACSAHLARYGGHRAAAGVELARGDLDAFAAAFVAHAEQALQPEDLVRVERVDAVVSGDELGLELAEELAALAPFGLGNPAVALLVPAATLRDARPMGEGRHVRFTVRSGGASARAVGFHTDGRLPVGEDEAADATFELEVNEYNGRVEPRLVLRHAARCAPAPMVVLDEPRGEFMEAAWEEVGRADAPAGAAAAQRRTVCDRRGHGVAGALMALVASGEPVLVVCADSQRRREHLAGRAGGFDMCSYATLERDAGVTSGYTQVAALDPPASALQDALLRGGPPEQHVHLLWGDGEVRYALSVLQRDHDLRPPLRALYRRLRDAGRDCGELGGGLSGAALERAVRGGAGAAEALGGAPGAPRLSAAATRLAGRMLRVLAEAGLADVDVVQRTVAIRVTAEATLELSATFREHSRRLAEGNALLREAAARAA